MPTKKPARYCSRCRTVHAGDCPHKEKHNWNHKRNSSYTGRGGRKWSRLRETVFKRDGYLCQKHLSLGVYMPVDLHGDNHGICDHIIPKAEGGTDDLSNLQTLCQACSKEKTQEESARARRLKI